MAHALCMTWVSSEGWQKSDPTSAKQDGGYKSKENDERSKRLLLWVAIKGAHNIQIFVALTINLRWVSIYRLSPRQQLDASMPLLSLVLSLFWNIYVGLYWPHKSMCSNRRFREWTPIYKYKAYWPYKPMFSRGKVGVWTWWFLESFGQAVWWVLEDVCINIPADLFSVIVIGPDNLKVTLESDLQVGPLQY